MRITNSSDEPVVIAPGTMTVPIQVWTRHQGCAQGPAAGGWLPCVDDGAGNWIPPLPPGTYDTKVVLNLPAELVTASTPIQVTLTG